MIAPSAIENVLRIADENIVLFAPDQGDEPTNEAIHMILQRTKETIEQKTRPVIIDFSNREVVPEAFLGLVFALHRDIGITLTNVSDALRNKLERMNMIDFLSKKHVNTTDSGAGELN